MVQSTYKNFDEIELIRYLLFIFVSPLENKMFKKFQQIIGLKKIRT